MQSRVLRCLATITLLILAVQMLTAQTGSTTSRQPAKYYIFNLGAPGGGSVAMAATLNNSGWISGDAFQAGNSSEHAELWLGAPVDLGTLGGPNSAISWPNKNDRGELAGISETGQPNPLGEDWSCSLANFPTITNQICLAFVWQAGVMTPLAPLPGGYNSYGSGINNRGQVVGWAENGTHESTCVSPQVLQFEAVIWGPRLGEITQLAPLGSDLDGAATAINDKGQVVGISGICDQAVGRFTAKHAVLWENGVASDLGNFDGGVAWNTPTAINNRGQIAGFANLPGDGSGKFDPVGFYWTKEKLIQEVPPVGSDGIDLAWGLNQSGQVVGQSCADTSFSSCRAFLWQNGVTTDLNSLIASNSSLYLLLANDINDRGEIVGYAVDSTTGNTVAFLAVPALGTGSDSKTTLAASRLQSVAVPVPEPLRQQMRQRVLGQLAR